MTFHLMASDDQHMMPTDKPIKSFKRSPRRLWRQAQPPSPPNHLSLPKVCRNGKCVAELENIIPDYTHVTQTISRSPISRSDTANNIVYNNMPLNNGRIRNKNRSTRSRSRRISSTTSSTTPSTTAAHYEARSDENLRENYGCVDQVEKMVGAFSA